MKNTLKFLSLVIVMAVFSCSSESITEDVNGIQDADMSSKAKQISVPVMEKPGGFPNGEFFVIEGASSTLQRNQNGFTGKIKTSGLIPNNAYTMWWVVFGESGPPTSTFATGHIAGGSGKGTFTAHKSVGPDFTNPLTAEVHLVIRSHGQAVPGMIPDQIHNFVLGCTTILPEGPGRIWPDSDELGRCANVQLAIHPSLN